MINRRILSDSEKKEYIDAVQCLQDRPQRSGFDGVVTRFDDFQGLHVNLTERVHLVGQFLPWHRRFVGLYETALREECGYTGAQPYWNWSLDVDNNRDLSDSPVFSSETGFGGNGVDGTYPDLFGTNTGWGGGCVLDGPFSSYTVALGPGRVVNPHCLVRSINHTMYQYLTSEALFRIELEGRNVTAIPKAHDGGHLAVGGDMGNVYSSPGDPLFFLHHANLDRIWWKWQTADVQNRLYQVSGRSTVQPPWVNVTLDYPLLTEPLASDIPIYDVMDIRSPPLCYTYA
ncbi:tyrosinase [Cyathus striatus]|nr:tyrosinase [Cyathus striatus]